MVGGIALVLVSSIVVTVIGVASITGTILSNSAALPGQSSVGNLPESLPESEPSAGILDGTLGSTQAM